MPKIEIEKIGWKCNRCDHVWEERKETEIGKPFVCPKCKSPKWDIPKEKE